MHFQAFLLINCNAFEKSCVTMSITHTCYPFHFLKETFFRVSENLMTISSSLMKLNDVK